MNHNPIFQNDIQAFTIPKELSDKLHDAEIIVTGATGLIGSIFVKCLLQARLGCHFILPVRNPDKARKIFESESNHISIIPTDDLSRFFSTLDFPCDYIVHCASPTNGKEISAHPVETFLLPIQSVNAILDFARRSPVKGIVYLSSIEYYGVITHNDPVDENQTGLIDRTSPRSAYPLGKQAAEYLCNSYAQEYGAPVKIARLTQTFGAGISPDDNRVFAQFARSVILGKDIELHTPGLSAKPYCYTTDCVSALLYILLKGAPGEAYNVATPDTYVTIRRLAELFSNASEGKSQVLISLKENAGYAPDTTVNLSPDKLLNLGWRPRYSLEDMILRLIAYLRESH